MRSVTFKFIHNIFLVVIFLFLILMDDNSFLGIWFHEIAGLTICLFYILHKALNWSWIKETTKKIIGKIPAKRRVNYIIDIMLLVGFTLIIMSGMAIAKTIEFSWLGFFRDHQMIYRSMHTSVSMIVLILVGIHIDLHWEWVTARFKRSR
jgi:hypothetical protein